MAGLCCSGSSIGLPVSHGSIRRTRPPISSRNDACPSHVIFIYLSLSVPITLPIPPQEKSPMEWMRQIDGYCERLDPGYWAEPINAVTNAAFVLAALIMWRRLGDAPLPLARVLVAILAAIGLGSFLFHTHAQVWSALADVLPIMAFVLVYLRREPRILAQGAAGVCLRGRGRHR